eukprot:8296814-Pyramimonas_sp.AAC.1
MCEHDFDTLAEYHDHAVEYHLPPPPLVVQPRVRREQRTERAGVPSHGTGADERHRQQEGARVPASGQAPRRGERRPDGSEDHRRRQWPQQRAVRADDENAAIARPEPSEHRGGAVRRADRRAPRGAEDAGAGLGLQRPGSGKGQGPRARRPPPVRVRGSTGGATAAPTEHRQSELREADR